MSPLIFPYQFAGTFGVTDTPVGAACFGCNEAIESHHLGFLFPHHGGWAAWHRICLLRGVHDLSEQAIAIQRRKEAKIAAFWRASGRWPAPRPRPSSASSPW